MLDRNCTQIASKMFSFFSKNIVQTLQKCLVNKLKAAAFTASFSACDIIESCVEIIVSTLNRPTKFW